ncbi:MULTISPECIES: MFS transporter [Flavobacterium]|uniref:MFS transporter n=1 Tax=Flavobacterium TaxID=237 RepID=UPI000745D559|nr:MULTISPECIES: MFS transporter [Flavobacterium]OXA75769.1 MFS transporter [Flavobacterium columnare] [Flavobacterium columnare NBRC 100251 = ATCC 23463]AMA48312.1 MFS transporter [Flavobacterium covae]AND63526.1 MFS transporter [Flavobacterium covae]MCH4830238.1 MFS transporter [Flavobacterium columnare]MCH4832379.1 MFS transporter [Flavobacterium columnare]
MEFIKKNRIHFNLEIKVIALITLINRMGAVVVPFLSKYLNETLGFTYSQIGWIMVCFGIGSLVGTFTSGRLSDIIGSYKVMIFSLFTSGIVFFILKYVKSFEAICFTVFLLTTIADMYRPAMMLTVNSYVSKDMKLQSLSLIRSASNLGLVFGPVIGGLVISYWNYDVLFWVDGITCLLAISVFSLLVKERKVPFDLNLTKTTLDRLAPIKDIPFVLNWIIAMITGYLFFQVFTILPLFQKNSFQLKDVTTGMLFGFSGILFILFEVRLINKMQVKRINETLAIIIGLILFSLGYFSLYCIHNSTVLWFFMALMTFGNMLTFSYASGLVLKRSHKNHEGIFMSVFQMSYGFAHVLSSKTGLSIVQYLGYEANWLINSIISIIGVGLTYLLYLTLKKEQISLKEKIAKQLFN